MKTIIELSKGYQITIPAATRKKYKLVPGTKIEYEDTNGSITLSPMEKLDYKVLWKKVDDMLKKDKAKKVTREEIIRAKHDSYDLS